MEETNGLITKEMMKNFMKKNNKTYYNHSSKYYSIVVDVCDDFFADTGVFGDREITDNIARTIKWYNIKDAIPNLCLRISRNKEIMNDLINDI